MESVHYTGKNSDFSIVPVPISYTRLGILGWLFDIGHKSRIESVSKRVLNAIERDPDVPKSIVCHSNGTRVFSLLSDEIKSAFDLVFFAGSVCHFDSDIQLHKCRKVINDCSQNDLVPLLAEIIRPNTFSQTGVIGFCNGPIVDRFYRFGHAGAKTNEHFENWIKQSVCKGKFDYKIPDRNPTTNRHAWPKRIRSVLIILIAAAVLISL